MKKIFFFSFLFIASLCLKSQTYYPFPDGVAQWKYASFRLTTSQGWIFDGYFHYHLEGDTLINGVMYSKLYTKYDFGTNQSKQYIGGVREHNKIVYFLYENIASPCGEIELYSFNHQDTINGTSCWYLLDHVNSFAGTKSVNGIARPYYLWTNSDSTEVKIIEGIGNTERPLIDTDVYLLPYKQKLVCFNDFKSNVSYLNDFIFIDDDLTHLPIYKSDTVSCSIATSIQSSKINISNIKIYPNPNSGIFQLDLSSLAFSNTAQIIITTVRGEIIYQKRINKNVEELNLQNLAKGLYVISIVDEKMKYYEKLIIE